MHKPLDGLKLLVVDDDMALRDIVASAVVSKGATVHTADNGTVAFRMTQELQIDVVILDVKMPGGDGVYLLESIQKVEGPKPKVIMMTGSMGVSRQMLLKKGAFIVLTKPFTEKELLAAILGQK